MPLSGHSGHFSNKIQKNTPSSRPARTNNLDSTLQPTFLKQSPNLYSLPYALPISRKHTQNARKRSCNTRTYAHKLPANNLQAPCQRRSNNRPPFSTRFQMLLPSLVTTRKTLVNTRKRSCITRPCTPKLPANNLPASGQRRSNSRRRISTCFQMLLPSLVTTRKTLVNTRKRSCITRPCTPELPANNLQAARQRSSNNRPQIFIRCQMLRQSLVNTRKRSCITRPCTPKLPANNLQVSRQRHSNNRPQISIRCQMLRQSLVNTRKRSCITRPCTHKLPANNLRAPCQRHSNTRPQISTCCQMLLPSLVNTRKRSCITRPCTHKLPAKSLPAAPTTVAPRSLLAVRCSSHLSGNHTQNARKHTLNARASLDHALPSCLRTICQPPRRSNNRGFSTRCQMLHQSLVNTRLRSRTACKLSASLAKHAYEHPSVRDALAIPKIPKNPANPASDNQKEPLAINPPPPTILPLPHFQYRVQAVLLSPIHYPLPFPPAVPPLVISP